MRPNLTDYTRDAEPSLGEQLRREIRRSGVTRYRLCREAGVCEPALARFMKGKGGLSLTTIERIARYLNLSLGYRNLIGRS